MLHEDDIDCVMDHTGRMTWFENLANHPIRLLDDVKRKK
jgi:hypothetical protein